MSAPRIVQVVSVFFVLMFYASVGGAPVYWSVNGHYYEVISTPTTWPDACSQATSLSHSGLTGHLVTLNTQQELDFVFDFVIIPSGVARLHTGGYQLPGAQHEFTSSWFWITGESAGIPCGGTHVSCGLYDEDTMESVLEGRCVNDSAWCMCRGFIVEYEPGTFACPTIESGGCPPAGCVSSCPGGGGCGNGTCQSGETCSSCPSDCYCEACGNGTCGVGETCANCAADCATGCGNGVCQNCESCSNCPSDCLCDVCGNGFCLAGETCSNCPQDCPPPPQGCPAASAWGQIALAALLIACGAALLRTNRKLGLS